MKIRSFGLLLMVVALAFSLAGCGCFQQAMKGEKAPSACTRATSRCAATGEKPEIVVANLRSSLRRL